MIGAFAEAVRATTQPCTLLLVAPPLLATIVTRGRMAPLVATVVAAVLGGWLYVANVVALSPVALQLSGVVVAAALVGAAFAHRSGRRLDHAGRIDVATAGGVTFVATLWWRPCVGSELGAILSDASRGLGPALPGMAAYMLGAMAPVVLVGLLLRAVDPPRTVESWLVSGAVVAGVIVAGSLAVGAHDQLVTTLTRWTLS